jgi:hypothetical protein
MSTIDQEFPIRPERGERPLGPRESTSLGLLLVVAVLVIVGAVAWWWHAQPAAPGAPAAPRLTQAPPVQAPAPSTPLPIHYPLAEAPEQPLAAGNVDAALAGLLGVKAVTTFLVTDGFARRLVATIDNLGRDSAPVAAWPVQPTGGRFTVDERPDGPVIAADNASRYTPFVLMMGSVDAKKAVDLYRRMYPLLQQAYRELGFGDRYLNDRVVQVIDLLLATPEPAQAARLQLTEVKGPVPSTRPWVRYQFADPELEQLAAGQKILVRVGLENERRLKAKLAEVRAQIVSGVPASPAR